MRGWPLRAGFLPADARLHWQPTCHAASPHRAVLHRTALASTGGHFWAAFFGFTTVLEFLFVADLLFVVLEIVFVAGPGSLGGARDSSTQVLRWYGGGKQRSARATLGANASAAGKSSVQRRRERRRRTRRSRVSGHQRRLRRQTRRQLHLAQQLRETGKQCKASQTEGRQLQQNSTARLSSQTQARLVVGFGLSGKSSGSSVGALDASGALYSGGGGSGALGAQLGGGRNLGASYSGGGFGALDARGDYFGGGDWDLAFGGYELCTNTAVLGAALQDLGSSAVQPDVAGGTPAWGFAGDQVLSRACPVLGKAKRLNRLCG